MKKTFLLALLLAFGINTMAHSIRFEFEEHAPVVTFWAGFSNTSPLVNAKVEVFGPDMKSPYQTGRLDQTGRFAFIPHDVGEWRLLVDDERGHRHTARVQIGASFFRLALAEVETEVETETETTEVLPLAPAGKQISAVNEIPLLYRVIFGLAIIFGLTGIFYGLSARKK